MPMRLGSNHQRCSAWWGRAAGPSLGTTRAGAKPGWFRPGELRHFAASSVLFRWLLGSSQHEVVVDLDHQRHDQS